MGDITYVPARAGWRYVAVLLDACSRRMVGWALADHRRTELAAEALTMALLASHGITASMSRAGDCYGNAMAERSFATMEAELLDTRPWPTRRAAQQAIFAWLEIFYTRQRSHSALDYQRPVAFELALAAEAQPA